LKEQKRYFGLLLVMALVTIIYGSCKPNASVITSSLVQSVNTAPVISTILGATELGTSWEVNLTCIATDIDGDKLNYSWSVENGTLKGAGNQVIWITPDIAGDYTVAVCVTDGKGGEVTASKSYKVATNPYGNETADTTIYLKLEMPSGVVVQESRRVRIWTTSEIQCVVPNIEAKELAYKWSSPVGKLTGNGIADGKASRVGWTSPGVAGSYTVSVTVTDKVGNEAKGEVTFEVLCCSDP